MIGICYAELRVDVNVCAEFTVGFASKYVNATLGSRTSH